MTLEHYRQILDAKGTFPKLAAFVMALKAVIPLDWIDTNDWQCNTSPGVYVHGRMHRFIMRRYCRCSKYDLRLALRFYQNN